MTARRTIPGGLAAAALGGAGLVAWLLRRSLPQVNGELRLEGITATVTVTRDDAGIPHIDASSMEDAAFAMGLVHAQDRLWQLELTRRVASGRISEFAGPDGVDADRFLRRVGLMRVAHEEAALLDHETGRMLESYARGVNTIIGSQRPLPLEFRLLRIRPQLWRPCDSIAAAKLLALSLSLNWDNELARLELLRAIGPERAARLDIIYPDVNPTILQATAAVTSGPVHGRALSMFQEAAAWMPAAGGGSNSWVVAGSLTATGRPLLCNDPHLQPSVPSVWYAAHVRAGADFESAGATVAGLPFPIIGHNRRCAWGYTNSFADAQDLVVEEFDGEARARYRTEAGWADTRMVAERIVVRGGATVVEKVAITRHGPVVEILDDGVAGACRGLALQWTALTPGGAAEALLRLQRAHDWPSFRAAFAPLDAPSQNVVYADVDGHIGYLLSGRIPVRRRAPSGLPVPGWTGDALWRGFLEPGEMPQALDPPEGILVTANNRVVGDEFPHYIAADYMNGYRAARLHQLLSRTAMDAGYMAEVQTDIVCLPARRATELLGSMRLEDQQAERLRRILARWDGRMDPEREEPALYDAFTARLAEHALRPICGDAWRLAAAHDRSHPLFGYPGNLAGRVLPGLLDRWSRDDEGLFEGATTWARVVSRSLVDGEADRRAHASHRPGGRGWGRLHRLPLEHPLGRRRPLNLIFDIGSIRVGGNIDTVFATSYAPNRPFETRLWAPSWRQITDVGDWDRCTAIHLPGQSGQRGSPHHHDLAGRWLRNHQIELSWSPSAVQGRAAATLRLLPLELAA